MKVLILCNNLTLPYIQMSGMAAPYALITELSKTLDTVVISSLSNKTTPLENIIYVKSNSLALARLKMFYKAFKILNSEKFDVILDFNSIPFFAVMLRIITLGKEIRRFSVLLTINETFAGKFLRIFSASLVNKFILTEQTSLSDFQKVRNVIYLPVVSDLTKFLSIGSYNEALHEEKRIIAIGSLEKRKGMEIFCKAGALSNANFKLFTYGQETRDKTYEFRLSKLSQYRTEIVSGMSNTTEEFGKCSVFVLPAVSRHGTLGLPLTLLEAMASERPCVVSDIYKNEQFLIDGTNCMFFDSENSVDLAEKLETLLNNHELAMNMARRARETILQKFQVDSIVKNWLEVLKA